MIRRWAVGVLLTTAACALAVACGASTGPVTPELTTPISLTPEDPASVVAPACSAAAPLAGFYDPRAPDYIVTFYAGTDVDATVAMLTAKYQFQTIHVYHGVSLLGFNAALTPSVVAKIRCEPTVKAVEYDAVVIGIADRANDTNVNCATA